MRERRPSSVSGGSDPDATVGSGGGGSPELGTMSKPKVDDGVVLNREHKGLLTLTEGGSKDLVHAESIHSKYTVEQIPFARGKFAAVRKCVEMSTGRQYAAKFIRKRRRTVSLIHEIWHEVSVLKMSQDSQRIVGFHEAFDSPSEMVLVLELAEGGELQRLIDEGEELEEREVIRLMRQIIEGVIFLHDRNVAHLDLKPQNLLLTGTYPHCDVKLCDFGISRVIQSGIDIREIMGTPDYVAPEILSYEPISLATDIWSLGVLTYVLLTGHSPFTGESKQETIFNVSQGILDFPEDLFERVSEAAKDFIRAALVLKPSGRVSARECLSHNWLSAECIPVSITVKAPQPALRLCEKENVNGHHRENGIDGNRVKAKRIKSPVELIVDEGMVC